MAFFQLRKPRADQPAPAAPAQTVEAIRRRAVHRLIGASVLVLAGVIGFPLVFDNQPRPIPVDLPIEIVDKNKVKPLVTPPATPAGAGVAAPAAAPIPIAVPRPVVPEPVAAAPSPDPAVPAAPPAPVAPARVAAAAPQAPAALSGDALKAQALLEGKTPATGAAAAARFVVQVGAFSETDKLREVRRRVEAAGLKTYTQVVQTQEGSRTRVRVGPFPDREQAAQAAEKIKKLDLPASILAL